MQGDYQDRDYDDPPAHPEEPGDQPGGNLGGDKGDTSEATIGTSLRCGPLQARQSNFFQRKISQGTTADATIRPIAIG